MGLYYYKCGGCDRILSSTDSGIKDGDYCEGCVRDRDFHTQANKERYLEQTAEYIKEHQEKLRKGRYHEGKS